MSLLIVTFSATLLHVRNMSAIVTNHLCLLLPFSSICVSFTRVALLLCSNCLFVPFVSIYWTPDSLDFLLVSAVLHNSLSKHVVHTTIWLHGICWILSLVLKLCWELQKSHSCPGNNSVVMALSSSGYQLPHACGFSLGVAASDPSSL